MTAGLAVMVMAVGLVGVLRAAAIVATGGEGRFRFHPLFSFVSGAGLTLLGQALLGT